MSTTQNSTSYVVPISIGPADGGQLNFGSEPGITDELVIQLVEAINALPWPGGAKPASAMKTVSQWTSSTPDFTVTPAAFD